ncbi:MAG: hypothetical protein ACAI35_00800 [Candidatus Methylacidiphilales bacterium]|nr:hypothetical protein [Candidatus Methylacidiphilales bacterium]
MPDPVGNSNTVVPPDATDFRNLSLDSIMMMVNSDRANMLDGQVRAQAAGIKAKNDLLIKANNFYAQMKDLQGQAGDGVSTMPKEMVDFMKDNGIKTDRTGNDDLHNKAEWDINMGYMKTFIDNLTSTSQLEMTQLQSVMNKFNQTTEGLSNWLSKDSQSKNTIVGNQR